MARFKVVLYAEAISDLERAIADYRKINPALAKRFHGAVNAAINDLKKNPLLCQKRYDNFRLKLVKKFPYLLHFIVEETAKTVFVYGIRPAQQNPQSAYFVNE